MDAEVAGDAAETVRARQVLELVAALERESRHYQRSRAARGELGAHPVGQSGLTDDQATLGGKEVSGHPASDHPCADDGGECGEPQCSYLSSAESAFDHEWLQDRDAQRVEAGELSQRRRLVERRMDDAQAVAVIEAGDLEQQNHQRHAGHDQQRGLVLAQDVEHEPECQAGSHDVGHSEQPPGERFAPQQRWLGTVGSVDQASAPREAPRGESDQRSAREPSRVRLVDRQLCGELRRHDFCAVNGRRL